jgi:hypothetical protein
MLNDHKLNNNSAEPKSPYFSVRVRIGDIKTPQTYLGWKERSIEVTYGNMLIRKTGEVDKLDIANEEKRTLKDEIIHAFEETDQLAELRGYKFIDEIPKGNDDPDLPKTRKVKP